MQVGVGQLGGAGDQRDVAAQVFGFAHADGQGAGGFDGGDTGGGVFDADALADVRAHALGGGEEDVGGGFGMRDGGRVGDGVEEVGQPHAFEQERCKAEFAAPSFHLGETLDDSEPRAGHRS